MRVTYVIGKEAILKEVRRLTHYGGHRKTGDEGAFERMRATESDKDMLEQFWKAACSAATEQLMHYTKCISNDDIGESTAYEVEMEMPSLYDVILNDSIEESLQNFFINLIASKWYKITSPEDEVKYAAEANGYMKDIENKIYHRKRPKRDEY